MLKQSKFCAYTAQKLAQLVEKTALACFLHLCHHSYQYATMLALSGSTVKQQQAVLLQPQDR